MMPSSSSTTTESQAPAEIAIHPAMLELNAINQEIKSRQDRLVGYTAELKQGGLPDAERLKMMVQISALGIEIRERFEKRKELLDLLNSDCVLVRCTKCPQVEKMTRTEADRRAPFVCPACWLGKYLDEHPELK